MHVGHLICYYSRRRETLKDWYHIEKVLAERTLRQAIAANDQQKYGASFHQKSFVPSYDSQHWYDVDRKQSSHKLMHVTNDHSSSNESQTFSAATQTQVYNNYNL